MYKQLIVFVMRVGTLSFVRGLVGHTAACQCCGANFVTSGTQKLLCVHIDVIGIFLGWAHFIRCVQQFLNSKQNLVGWVTQRNT